MALLAESKFGKFWPMTGELMTGTVAGRPCRRREDPSLPSDACPHCPRNTHLGHSAPSTIHPKLIVKQLSFWACVHSSSASSSSTSLSRSAVPVTHALHFWQKFTAAPDTHSNTSARPLHAAMAFLSLSLPLPRPRTSRPARPTMSHATPSPDFAHPHPHPHPHPSPRLETPRHSFHEDVARMRKIRAIMWTNRKVRHFALLCRPCRRYLLSLVSCSAATRASLLVSICLFAC